MRKRKKPQCAPDEPEVVMRRGPDGKPGVEMRHHLIGLFAEAFLDILDASNYVEQSLWSPERGRVLLTIQRPDATTPHGARAAAEAEARRLRALLAEHGIDPGPDPLTYAPPSPPDAGKFRQPEMPWLLVDVRQEPARMVCEGCGQSAPLAMPCAAPVLQAAIGAFAKMHAGCGPKETRDG